MDIEVEEDEQGKLEILGPELRQKSIECESSGYWKSFFLNSKEENSQQSSSL